jgi:hypothetical protein
MTGGPTFRSSPSTTDLVPMSSSGEVKHTFVALDPGIHPALLRHPRVSQRENPGIPRRFWFYTKVFVRPPVVGLPYHRHTGRARGRRKFTPGI